MKPIMVDRNVEKSCFRFEHWCGDKATPSQAVNIKIKRAGTAEYQIEYPADIQPDGSVCFEWGDIFYNLKAGRYVADIFDGDIKIDRVQFQLYPQGFKAVPV